MAGLHVFYDSFSQPSRAVLLLLHANNVKFEPHVIRIGKGENKTNKEFLIVSYHKNVPAIDDNGFTLSESSAILRYLVTKYRLPDHWYPADIEKRARVDEYLSWHHANLRLGAGELIFNNAFMSYVHGKEADPQRTIVLKALLVKSKNDLEAYFLRGRRFICGDEISIADLQAVCELTQFWVVGIDPTEGRPVIARWMDDVQATLQPHFNEVHNMVYMARDRSLQGKTIYELRS